MKRPLDPRITEEEAALFRAAVHDAVPLRAGARHHRPTPAPPPVPVQSLLDERAALAESRHGALDDDDAALEAGDALAYVRAGVSRQVLRRLRRGHWVVQDHLDLHGMNRAQAHEAVAGFLRQAGRRAHRCVRIVHGKGLGSKNREPVLKGKVGAWLARREDVLAFCQTPAAQGGSGAVLVLLRA